MVKTFTTLLIIVFLYFKIANGYACPVHARFDTNECFNPQSIIKFIKAYVSKLESNHKKYKLTKELIVFLNKYKHVTFDEYEKNNFQTISSLPAIPNTESYDDLVPVLNNNNIKTH